jgi:hypothetical protein
MTFKILSNTVVGLGFSYSAFKAGLAERPDMIGCDAGSSDFGPYYLGSGRDPKATRSVRRDLEIMMSGARDLGVPLVLGSSGGAGADEHLKGYAALVRDVAAHLGWRCRVATISAQLSAATVHDKLRAGQITPLGPVPALTDADVDASVRIVGMMGVEPIMASLDGGADVVLAGRAADPAIFAAVALRAGVAPGLAWHAGKSADKGALATDRPDAGSPLLVSIETDGFRVEACKPTVRCTPATVAALTMHENPDPFRVIQPGGTIDTTHAEYLALDERSVWVSGSHFTRDDPFTVKLEGAALEGYRSLLIAGIRDPRVIERFDEFLARYRDSVARVVRSIGVEEDQYTLGFRCYGRDGVLGDRESALVTAPHEIGLIVDVVGETEEISRAIATRLGPLGSRLDITGRQGGGGNFAYPFSPSVIPVGPVYRWSVWHTMAIETEEIPELFPITFEEVPQS